MSQEPLLEQNQDKQASTLLVVAIIVAISAIVILWLLNDDRTELETPPVVITAPLEEVDKTPETTTLEPTESALENIPDEPDMIPVESESTEPVIAEPALPPLNQSDDFVSAKLPEITWRQELLKLLITDDIIRRFVVFTDNFSQGNLSYDHSLFVLPKSVFYAQEQSSDVWQWDESSSQRFSSYVDLLRTLDSSELVAFYYQIKPLVDQAYQELGYPESDFTDVLQTAITRVLDMEFPKEALILTRPSVMYKYQDQTIESLDDADKLLLRIGRENLLVIKSILLEINDKLSRANVNE